MSVTAVAAMADPAARSDFLPDIGMKPPLLATRFGRIRIDPDRLLTFPAGMPGFPGCRRFQLERIAGGGPLLLQSIDDGQLGFFVVPLAGRMPLIRRADLAAACRLASLDPSRTECLAIVTVRRGSGGLELLANLRAPVLIDAHRRVGAQVVLADATYPLRHPVTAAA
jgi:flagellar assembly factor FliW